jgi:hypothetical protein
MLLYKQAQRCPRKMFKNVYDLHEELKFYTEGEYKIWEFVHVTSKLTTQWKRAGKSPF